MVKSCMDVVVVGSCNVDLVVFTEIMPQPGETVSGNEFMMVNGGKGGNQAAMLARLGANVCMVARVGDDTFGTMYKNQLENYGADVSHIITTKDCHTGTATIIVNKCTGQNRIILAAGANSKLSENDLNGDIEKTISQCKVLAVQLEVNKNVSLKALKLAKKYGVITIFNTAPAYSDIDLEFYKNTDILCFNETELEILTGMKVDIENEESQKKALYKILDFGCKAAVFTIGKYGAKLIFNSNRNKIHNFTAKIHQNQVKDTTGAGDCLIGCMAYFVSKNITKKDMKLEEILTPTVINNSVNIASITVTKKGSQTSYPAYNEIPIEFLN